MALKLKADLKAGMGLWDEALVGYDAYLAVANDLDDGQDFWNARVNKAMVYAELYAQAPEGEGDPNNLALALGEFEELTTENPFYFEGWFGLGNTYQQLGDTERAITAWEKGVQVAMDDNRKWAAETKIAEAKGEELPEAPAGMMGGGEGMGGGGTANPHGGDMGGGAGMGGDEGMANPHGGM